MTPEGCGCLIFNEQDWPKATSLRVCVNLCVGRSHRADGKQIALALTRGSLDSGTDPGVCRRFEKYPDALQAAADFFHDLERTQTELLKQIQAERRQR